MNKTNTVLIVDDQMDIRMSAAIVLNNHGFETLEACSPEQALEMVSSYTIDLILLDMNFSMDTTSGQEGLNFLSVLKQRKLSMPVVAMTGWASIDVAVQSMQLGACDFIEKPWQNNRLISIVTQQLASAQLNKENQRYSENEQNHTSVDFIVTDGLSDLLKKATMAARSDANILVTGENGTGKSLLAQFIHQQSERGRQRFVSVNMGAIPETLFESELFGHKKGAFTDAKESRLGRFDIASDGTLFLDEIGCLPTGLQAKMLRVLETGEYEVLGSSQTQHTNARIISATNADLDHLINEQGFRKDLFFRLNTIELKIPPLRERSQDIIALAEHFLEKHGKRYQRISMSFTSCAYQAMQSHQWLGNIRELSHCIERAVILTEVKELTAYHLALSDSQYSGSQNNGLEPPLQTLEQAEHQTIVTALKHFKGNVITTAEYFNMSKSALYRRLEKFAIDPQKVKAQ